MTRRNAKSPLDAMRDSHTGASPGVSHAGTGRAPSLPPVVGMIGRGLTLAGRRFSDAVIALGERIGSPGGSVPGGRLKNRLAVARDELSSRVGEIWWIGSAEPVTLRLPRGVTVLVIAGVVGIIVMAFAVGRRSGQSVQLAGTDAVRAAAERNPGEAAASSAWSQPAALESVPGGAEWPDATAAEEVAAPLDAAARLQARFDAGLDPRVDGLNYLVYMTATRRECLRLADFLAEHGAGQAIVMRSSRTVRAGDDNGQVVELPLYWVVDVAQGFTRNQYLRGEHAAFREERMELGRAWKQFNGGRGSDLSDMQFYAYRASPPAR